MRRTDALQEFVPSERAQVLSLARFIFTCGFQDAGLGIVGSLLNLHLLLTNEFRKANRAKVSTPKGARKGYLAMTKPLVRSDMASEAVRRPKQPRRICLKKSGS